MIDSSGKEGVLEIHKCPRDVWIKEVETLVDKAIAAANKTAASTQDNAEATPQPVSLKDSYSNEDYNGSDKDSVINKCLI